MPHAYWTRGMRELTVTIAPSSRDERKRVAPATQEQVNYCLRMVRATMCGPTKTAAHWDRLYWAAKASRGER